MPERRRLKFGAMSAVEATLKLVERRWVLLQGCVTSPDLIAPLEAAARAVPEVESVIPMLGVGIATKPRYTVVQP